MTRRAQDTQDRTRKRIKEDIKDSAIAYQEYAEHNLPRAKRAYLRKCQEVEVGEPSSTVCNCNCMVPSRTTKTAIMRHQPALPCNLTRLRSHPHVLTPPPDPLQLHLRNHCVRLLAVRQVINNSLETDRQVLLTHYRISHIKVCVGGILHQHAVT